MWPQKRPVGSIAQEYPVRENESEANETQSACTCLPGLAMDLSDPLVNKGALLQVPFAVRPDPASRTPSSNSRTLAHGIGVFGCVHVDTISLTPTAERLLTNAWALPFARGRCSVLHLHSTWQFRGGGESRRGTVAAVQDACDLKHSRIDDHVELAQQMVLEEEGADDASRIPVFDGARPVHRPIAVSLSLPAMAETTDW